MPRIFLLAAVTALATSPTAAATDDSQKLAAACAAWSIDHFMVTTWATKAGDLAAILERGSADARNGARNLRRLIEAAEPATNRTAGLMARLCAPSAVTR